MSLRLHSPAAAPPPVSPPRRFAVSPALAWVGVGFAAPLRSASASEGLTVVDGLGRFFAPQTNDTVLFARVGLALVRRRALSTSRRRLACAAGSNNSFERFEAAAPSFAFAAPGWTARGSPAPGRAGNPSEPGYSPIRF